MELNTVLEYITTILLIYYTSYRHLEYDPDEQLHEEFKEFIYQYYIKRFPTNKFNDYVECIEILAFPYESTYLLNNDVSVFDTILDKVTWYIKQRPHTITNNDTVVSINPVPFDGFEIFHGDLLFLLDPIFLK